MKKIILTTAALFTISVTPNAANLDAKYIYKERGEAEKVIRVNLPEVIIQATKMGSHMQKAVLINDELVIVYFLPAVEIVAEKPANMSSVMKELTQVQLPEVIIESSTVTNFQSAYLNGNQAIPAVQLPEVVITSEAGNTHTLIALDEKSSGMNVKIFNLPAVSVEFALLINIIYLIMAFFIPPAG